MSLRGWSDLRARRRGSGRRKVECAVLEALGRVYGAIDVLLVLDQVSEPDCGVITQRVRQRLIEMGGRSEKPWILADSRERIGLFQNVCVKPNVEIGRASCRERV